MVLGWKVRFFPPRELTDSSIVQVLRSPRRDYVAEHAGDLLPTISLGHAK